MSILLLQQSKNIKSVVWLILGPIAVFFSYGVFDYKYQFFFNYTMFGLVLTVSTLSFLIYHYALYLAASRSRGAKQKKVSAVILVFPVVGLMFLHYPLYQSNKMMVENEVHAQEVFEGESSGLKSGLVDTQYASVQSTDNEGQTAYTEPSLPVIPTADATSRHFLPTEHRLDLRVQLTQRLNNSLKEFASVDDADQALFQTSQQYGQKLAELIKAEKWDDIASLMSEYEGDIPDLHTVTANVLLMFGASSDVVEQYIVEGALISGPAALSLIQNGKIDDLIRLENMGVTFDDELPLDLNLLDLALMSKLSPNGFEFLINRVSDVGQFKPVLGVDTLAVAILTAQNNSAFIANYIDAIIDKSDNGVSNYHVDLIRMLAQQNPTLAEEIGLINQSLSTGG